MRNIHISIIILTTLSLITGCNGCNKQSEMQPIEIKPVTYEVKLNRFEKELFEADQNQLKETLTKLKDKYGVFYTSYARDIMRMPEDKNDPLFLNNMKMLLSINRMIELQQIVDSNFKDVSDIEHNLSEAMGRYKTAFPEAGIPQFTTFISEFGNGNVIYDSMICIGLDFYMNNRFLAFYRGLQFPEFMIAKMQRAYIVPNALKALAIGQFDRQTDKDKRFLAQMLLEGKIRYFIKALLPNTPDTVIMGYSQQQWEWCMNNEAEIWKHFIDKNMLYESNPAAFMRYLNDGPFTVAEGVPPESSPAIGAWMGWKIINEYMKQNPKVTLRELMNNVKFDDILKQSKYRPK
jgi:hypothetical protein